MPADLDIAGHRFNADLVIFDKDGTLVDYDLLWSGKNRAGVEALVASVNGGPALAQALYRTLGFDPETGITLPDTPLAVSSLDKINIIAAAVLHQHGTTWHDAEELVVEHFASIINAVPEPAMIRPLGDVAGLFRSLKEQGVKIAIATSDNRGPTLATLPLLGIESLVDILVCGDDPIPNKPNPQAIHHIAAELDVAVDRSVMVGDSLCDMETGRAAEVGCSVAVLCGTGDRDVLESVADRVVRGIDAIGVVAKN